MSMNTNRFCPQCGSPTDPSQRFCGNCGSAVDVTTVNPNPTELKAGPSTPDLAALSTQQGPGPGPISGVAAPIPPPPPDIFQSATTADYQAPQVPYQVVPDFARPQKGATRRTGLRFLIAFLVLLLVLGAIGGTIYYLRGKNSSTSNNTSNANNTNAYASTSTNTGTAVTPVPTGGSSGQASPINGTITYRSVDITIISVDQQEKYNDDSSSQSPYLLRISIKEHNASKNSVYLFYNESFRLVEADGTQVAPVRAQDGGGISQDVVRSNWVDFPVNSKLNVSKLILRIGTNTEHQIDVPLQQNPNLSQYQPITVKPNATLQYGGVNWTVTQATAQLSAEGTQATAGNRYIVLTLKADNPSNSSFYPFPSDNFRLQAPDVTTAPANSTLPSSIAAGSSGATGTVTFLMPQNDKAFTLTFLAQPNQKILEASANIQF
jgi:Domain of unknown function (DUF4352)